MFTTDNRTENFLTQLGVKFEYRNGILLPSGFVKGWDTENIGRPVAVREDAVLEYSSLMESGSAAPAPILVEYPDGMKPLDGVQRLKAAELLDTSRISAYVIETDSEDLIAMIRVLANARLQGRAEPAEWTRRRAVQVLVVERGMTHAEVAAMGGWAKAEVGRIAQAIAVQNRISELGGPKLPDTMLSLLNGKVKKSQLAKAADPIVGFLSTLKQSQMSASDAEPYVDSFFAPVPKAKNPHNTYRDRLDLVHKDPEIIARTTGRRIGELPKDAVLLRTLKSAETTVDQMLSNGKRVTYVDEYFHIIGRIEKKLKSVAPTRRGK